MKGVERHPPTVAPAHGLYMPKYAMVTFHRIPYAVAQQRGRIQDRLLDELCAGIDRLEDIDWSRAALLVHRDLTQMEKG